MNTPQDTLEQLVDSMGLAYVVHALEQVCYEKADHLRSNWGDVPAAKEWERDAKKLDTCANKLYH